MDRPRVQHLIGYGMKVPDLDAAEHFFTAFGLSERKVEDRLEFRCREGSEAAIVVLQGPAKRLHHISFAIAGNDVERFSEHLESIGSPAVEPPFGPIRAGLWFCDPWGTWINLAPADALSFDHEPKMVHPRIDRHLWRELDSKVIPNRIGHLLIFTQDYEAAEEFYSRALGLQVSDRALGKVSFMAGGQGVRDHHCFGLINGTHRGLQHSSFQVDSVDVVGFGAMQMRAAGYHRGFGIGRHALASNLFHYTRDPWGSWIEYYADMDKISDAWEANDWQNLPYIWPEWAPEFWTNEMNFNHESRD